MVLSEAYRLRRADGSSDEPSSGTLVEADGASQRLAAGDFSIEPRGWWISPATGVRYPSGWRLTVPGAELDLVITPLLPNQEIALSVRYWEGAVAVEGSSASGAVTGHGYVELTGYE